MKPENWDDIAPETRLQIARDLFYSLRGGYIVGQALYKAIGVMKKAKYPETSNIQDMEMLAEMLFPLGYFIASSEVKSKIKKSKGKAIKS